ncbi:phage tail fiber protein [Pseudomonas weihenstephanensis]|uniref:phage tail fiber domain-containing protein n=1 Tax=Pseudomonas weihenstephanensis TaxID=1608994 RepID=UPI00193AE903|nr:phage tail fiber protein [Pseudomonas weihenstephanensis]MBM1189347.1 hypothetical protein [Pseudomonas weihenstephanensis]
MAAPKTVLTYPLDGSRKDFDIPFEYLARKFVVITLVGATRRVLIANSDYRFATKRTITTTKAWGPGDLFNSIEIRRVTSATERLVDFSDGSVLRAYDLNTSQVQSLHIAEEARDLTADTIGVNNDGDLDARGRRIVNVADGLGDGDAVNLRQQKAWAGSALNQANRAQQEADRATSQANSATSQAGIAIAQAGIAKSEADRATTQANSATSQAGIAVAQAVIATSQANSATSQAGIAQSEADRATSQANSATSQAGIAKSEADRARTEADRAKVEAGKLGSANQFMGTLSQIDNAWVYWKYPYGLATSRMATDKIVGYRSNLVIDAATSFTSYINVNAGGFVTGNWQASGNVVAGGSISCTDALTTQSTLNAHEVSLWENGARQSRISTKGNIESPLYLGGSTYDELVLHRAVLQWKNAGARWRMRERLVFEGTFAGNTTITFRERMDIYDTVWVSDKSNSTKRLPSVLAFPAVGVEWFLSNAGAWYAVVWMDANYTTLKMVGWSGSATDILRIYVSERYTPFI